MKTSRLFLFLFVGTGMAFLGFSCEKDLLQEDIAPLADAQAVSLRSLADAVIDFNGLERGTIVSSLAVDAGISGSDATGTVSVYGENIADGRPETNHAMIFDTDNPSGFDPDLVVPDSNFQEILIISEDLDSEDPDDQRRPGGTFTFEFTDFGPGAVGVLSFTAIDTEGGGEWWAYNGETLEASGDIDEIPNGTAQNVEVNAEIVTRLVIRLPESGGIDNIRMAVDEQAGSLCPENDTYWMRAASGPWPAPHDRAAEFYLSEQSWQQVLRTRAKDQAYYLLAHQYIAGELNDAAGAPSTPRVKLAMQTARELFSQYAPDAMAEMTIADAKMREQCHDLTELLSQYNEGLIIKGNCGGDNPNIMWLNRRFE